MSLPYHQQRRLRQIRRTLSASDPHLAAMLAIFARLTTGEQMPGRERIPRRLPLAVRALACVASAAACLAGHMLLACGQVMRRAAERSLAVRGFLASRLRRAASGWRGTSGQPAPIPPGSVAGNE